MAIIIPAILPTSLADLTEKLGRLVGIASEVQVDIVDGRFAAPASWPYANGTATFGGSIGSDTGFPYLDYLRVEVDLMVKDPEEVTGSWIAAGATRILAHLESTTYLPRLVTDLKVKYGHEKGFAPDLLSFGLALDIATDLSLIEPYLHDIDYVQFMGIKKIGVQGQPFATEVLEKIRTFRKAHPEIALQVDGGVNKDSAPLLLSAGVSRLIVGSALFKAPDLKRAFKELSELTEEHGIYE